MKLITFLIFTTTIFSSCKSLINRNYNYQKTISPKEIKVDIDALKGDLVEFHYDINWENKKDQIFADLDLIRNIDLPITLDSFEQMLTEIINGIDDGHSKVIRQRILKDKTVIFGTTRISDSMHYLKIGNFLETSKLYEVLKNFQSSFEENPTKNVLIDIRFNPGGSIDNVNYFLSFFLPSKTELYDRFDIKEGSGISKLSSFVNKSKYNLGFFKNTSKKKLNGSPNLYLLINEKIASGSMLSSYNLQNNGAYIIGKPPNGLFNTFGQVRGHKLPRSKLVYGLASARVFLAKETPNRMEDMLKPDYIPGENVNINQIIEYIDNLSYSK